jgi:hypothetical protein
MKQFVLSLIMTTGFVIFGTQIAEAQDRESATQQKGISATNNLERPGYTDANIDGICDNYDGQRAGMGLGPENGNGKGRVTGKGLGQGKGLRDGSGSGSHQCRSGKRVRNGSGQGQRLRDGSGPNCSNAI